MRSRIELTDSLIDIVTKMSEGNPGAITVIMEIMRQGPIVDPQNVLGGVSPLLSLDTWEIYGSDIYVLFNDKCQRDVRILLMLMRATQLGFLPQSKLQQMASDQMGEVNLTDEEMADLDEKVCAQLEEFKKAP